MSKRLTTAEFISKAQQVHNGKYDYSDTVYIDSRTKLTIICPIHGRFEQRGASHLMGNGCPACAKAWSDEHRKNHQESSRRSRGITTAEWVARARAVHGHKYDYSKTVYVNQRTDVTIICPIHGEFEQKADSHIRGFGCRFCGFETAARQFDRTWSDKQREKIANTCQQKYGAKRYLDSEEGRAKIHVIKSDPEFRAKMSGIISSSEVQEKTKATSRERYGVDFPMQTKAVQDKVYRTKKRNHTVSSSRSEVRMGLLLVDRFGEENVVHQYKHDSRYPFMCDFYVASLDLFIELNAHWTHGRHWFDSVVDADKLAFWQKRAYQDGSSYYKAAIETWTVRDVKKRRMALDNHLNYLAFWKSDLSDFKAWLESDELVLCNISE